MIKAEKIGKRLGGKQILEGIDFEVAPGEIIAVIGPSGCGKTTLLRSLAMLAPPDSGTLTINAEVFRFPDHAIAPWQTIYPLLTVVSQQFPLWPHLNVRRNLLMPLQLTGKSGVEQKMDELSVELGIDSCLNRFPEELSVGQRQRVAFARALLLQPKYLLLDEITSAQDVEHIKGMMSLIKRVAANGTSVVLATHLIRFARRLASRFYFLDQGRIIEKGLTIELQTPQTERLKDFLFVGDEL